MTRTWRRAMRLCRWLAALAVGVSVVVWAVAVGLRESGRRVTMRGAGSVQALNVLAPVPTRGPLHVHPRNPRYFADADGHPVLLAGAHTWYTLQDSGWSDPPRPFDYHAYLASLRARGHNFFRLFVWEQSRWSVAITGNYFFTPQPYARTGPGVALDGKPKFDLAAFNQAYFDRLRARVQEARVNGIYVSIQLFDGFSVEAKPSMAAQNPWRGHPFNRNNNINGIDGDADGDGEGSEVQTLALPAVTALQDAYVRKVIDSVNDLDNVLFEVCNEANERSTAWQYRLIGLIKSYEATLARQHPVGMTVEWPNGVNADVFASDADWISPNALDDYYRNPPPADGRKVIINDTDHLCFPCGDTPFVWRSVLRGLNPAFMDPYDCRNDVASSCNPMAPRWELVRKNLGYARALLDTTNLAALAPRPAVCSTSFCLAQTDTSSPEYVAYLPAGRTLWRLLDVFGVTRRRPPLYWPTDSRVSVDLTSAGGTLDVEWFDPSSGLLRTGETTTGGGIRTFTAPFSGQAVLHIHQRRAAGGR